MRWLTLLLLATLFLPAVAADTPSVDWARQGLVPQNANGESVVFDTSGNLYACGEFEDQITLGATTHVGTGTYLAKYDTAGTVLWSVAALTANPDTCIAWTAGSRVGLLPGGNVVWAVAASALGDPCASECEIQLGDSLLTGAGVHQVTFSPGGAILSIVNTAAGLLGCKPFEGPYPDASGEIVWTVNAFSGTAMVTRQDSLFNFIWMHPYYQNLGSIYIGCAATGAGGMTAAGGNFQDRIDFGPGVRIATPDTVYGGSSVDGFVTVINSLNSAVWTVQIAGGGWSEVEAVAFSPSGDAIAGGYVNGPTSIDVMDITPVSPSDEAFVARFDLSGTPLWVRTIPGTDYSRTVAVTTEPNGTVTAGFIFGGTVTVAGLNFVTGPNDYADILVVQYSAGGIVQSVLHLGANNDDYLEDLATDGSGGIGLTGRFHSASLAMGSDLLSAPPGGKDMFVAHLGGGVSTGVSTPTVTVLPALLQNHPNPFNPSTSITFTLPARQMVRLTVHDALGRTVAVLLDAQRSEGPHTVRWDGVDNSGRVLPSGVYFYRLSTPHGSVARKMVLVK